MESLLIAWRLLLLLSVFAFPQLLGILLYFRLRWAPRWIAMIVGVFAPTILFVLLSPILLFAGAREAAARGELCGTGALGAFYLLFLGTAIQFGVGLVTQVILATRRRQPRAPIPQ